MLHDFKQGSASLLKALVLRPAKRLVAFLGGTAGETALWRFRHLIDPQWPLDYLSPESINHPHRSLLLSHIKSYAPLESVLELGCASGPNLYLLAREFAGAKLYGIEISKHAIEMGKQWLKEHGVKDISFIHGSINALKTMPARSIDLVFSDASLIYVGPEKIKEALKEMLRVTRKVLILFERHSEGHDSFYDGHWVHDYKKLIGEFIPEEKIKLIKIPPQMWPGQWAKYGYIIVVRQAHHNPKPSSKD